MKGIFRTSAETILYTPGVDLDAGAVVVNGNLLGVTKSTIKSGEAGTLAISGVFEFAKEPNLEITAGDIIRWDEGNNRATKTGGNPILGLAIAASAATDTTVHGVLKTADSTIVTAETPLNVSIGETEAAGSNKDDATELDGNDGLYVLTTGGAGRGVILADAQAVTGNVIQLVNTNGTTGIEVYPNAGGSIDGAAANAALTLAAKKGVTLVCIDEDTGNWRSV